MENRGRVGMFAGDGDCDDMQFAVSGAETSTRRDGGIRGGSSTCKRLAVTQF